jgi:hypothetical protein
MGARGGRSRRGRSGRGGGGRVRRLVLVVDVEGYSGRAYSAQEKVQDGVARALSHACGRAGVRWTDCERQDRGDGQLLLLPSGIDEGRAVPGLVLGLRDMLPVLNARVPAEHVIRLRVALAQGAVQIARLGYVGDAVESASRLLDSAELRAELGGAPDSDLALIVPEDLYADCFARGAGGLPATVLRRARVTAKNFSAHAWLGALPRGRTAPLGIPTLPPAGPLDRPSRKAAGYAAQAAVDVAATLVLTKMLPEHPGPAHFPGTSDSPDRAPDGTGDAGQAHAAGHHGPAAAPAGQSAADRPAHGAGAGGTADTAESVAALGDGIDGSLGMNGAHLALFPGDTDFWPDPDPLLTPDDPDAMNAMDAMDGLGDLGAPDDFGTGDPGDGDGLADFSDAHDVDGFVRPADFAGPDPYPYPDGGHHDAGTGHDHGW